MTGEQLTTNATAPPPDEPQLGPIIGTVSGVYTKLDTVRALVRPAGALVGIIVIAATPIVGAIVGGLTWKEAITIEVTFFGPLVGFFYQLRNSQKTNGGAS